MNCYRLETDGVDFKGEKLYMSADFIKMMWRRTWFLLEVLIRGYCFIFTVRFLDTLYFSGFWQDSKDFRAVAIVHANCCQSINAKVKDLRVVLRDWKRFKKIMSYPRFAGVNVRETFRWTRHWGCWNSWKVDDKTKV
ncbi:hypothetical protein TIFTF001_017461 [Ficus carica]|uniref:Nucleotide-diphospho-sugar transferase domain-containing protein n=1 Tax=Ficus carica TaxID=3494 RepID=A0AA88D717_FICCA|nr:hypothetical protein TIFTF001_017461 [Ficus carica]